MWLEGYVLCVHNASPSWWRNSLATHRQQIETDIFKLAVIEIAEQGSKNDESGFPASKALKLSNCNQNLRAHENKAG